MPLNFWLNKSALCTAVSSVARWTRRTFTDKSKALRRRSQLTSGPAPWRPLCEPASFCSASPYIFSLTRHCDVTHDAAAQTTRNPRVSTDTHVLMFTSRLEVHFCLPWIGPCPVQSLHTSPQSRVQRSQRGVKEQVEGGALMASISGIRSQSTSEPQLALELLIFAPQAKLNRSLCTEERTSVPGVRLGFHRSCAQKKCQRGSGDLSRERPLCSCHVVCTNATRRRAVCPTLFFTLSAKSCPQE